MMDDVELGQQILDLLRDNTDCAEQAIWVLSLVIVKIILVSRMETPDLDAHISRLLAMMRHDRDATDEVLQ
jgi:hypothetical protein